MDKKKEKKISSPASLCFGQMATVITTGWTHFHILMTGNALSMKATLKGRRIFVFLRINGVAGITRKNCLSRVKCAMMMAAHAYCHLITMKIIG